LFFFCNLISVKWNEVLRNNICTLDALQIEIQNVTSNYKNVTFNVCEKILSCCETSSDIGEYHLQQLQKFNVNKVILIKEDANSNR
jgi:hypothetical protein